MEKYQNVLKLYKAYGWDYNSIKSLKELTLEDKCKIQEIRSSGKTYLKVPKFGFDVEDEIENVSAESAKCFAYLIEKGYDVFKIKG